MIKLQRSGFTETNLIFIDSLDIKKIDHNLVKLKNLDINRMYSKAGFYDKDIKGQYFDIDVQTAEKSGNFTRWLIDYKNSLLNCSYLEAMSHIRSYPEYAHYKTDLNIFIDSLNHQNFNNMNYHNFWKKPQCIFTFLTNKKILVVNSFASLIYQQYESGNVHKIYHNFPYFQNIDYIDFPYTFFNNGPHKNFFETLDYYMGLVAQKDFEIALVSCGPYGCIMVDRIIRDLNKNAFTMGSGITPMFGINPKIKEPHWIGIPDRYIPEGYTKIENGRYWT